MIVMIVCSTLHLIVCALFIFYFNFDVYGLGVSTILTYAVQLSILIIYANHKEEIKEAIFLPNYETFQDWREYFDLALPATFIICGEWWAYELLSIMSGRLGIVV